jgi:hypothetical protein
MNWLANPLLQGVGAVAGIVGAVAAVLSVPFFYRRNSQKNHSSEVVARFLYLFKAHGLERTQIPRFLGDEFGISVADVSTDENLLLALNEEILNTACNRFGVRRAWLDGADKKIYELLYYYKDLPEYVSFIKFQTEKHSDQSCLLNAYKPVHTSTDLFKSCPDISLVFAEPIAEIDQQTIYRYYPFYGPFPWSYTPARFNLYAFFTIAFATSGIVLKGYDVSPKFISELAEGKIISETIKTDGTWHPDDYAFSAISHDMPMDSREIDGFWKYINDKGWLELFDKNIITRPH